MFSSEQLVGPSEHWNQRSSATKYQNYLNGRIPPCVDRPFCWQETAEERWRPILGVEGIIVSVISMLSDPNDESPANIDAAVMWRNDRDSFKRKSRLLVRKSQDAL